MIKNVGYHTRLRANSTVKIAGGSFGGSFSIDTANRLVNAHFTVKINSLGQPVFVDRKGREVWLYLTVDPGNTDAGSLALAEHRKVLDEAHKREDATRERIQDIIESMDPDTVLSLLTAGKE